MKSFLFLTQHKFIISQVVVYKKTFDISCEDRTFYVQFLRPIFMAK